MFTHCRPGFTRSLILVLLLSVLLSGCSGNRGTEWVSLELTLDVDTVVAGTPVGYLAEVVAESGTKRTVEVELGSDIEAALAYTVADVTPRAAGQHLLTATTTIDGQTLSGEASLAVTAGEPLTIELSLSDDSPEVGQRVTASAAILDEHGNDTEAAWTVSVIPGPSTDASSAVIEEHRITFTAEGWFTVEGTVDSNGISDAIGPFVVDSFAPTLLVTHPERGTSTTSFDDIVTGTVTDEWSTIAEVTVNGAEVAVGGGGAFEQEVTYLFGTNLVETLATDSDGNTATDRRAVLAGEFVPGNEGVPNGVITRINESTIETIETMAEELIAGVDVAGMIPNPVFSDSSEECVDIPWVGETCVTIYELVLRATNLRYGAVEVELDPRAEGFIATSATVRDISVDWNARGVLTEIGYSASGRISANSISVSMNITPSVRDGELHAAVSNVRVTSEGFVFDFNSWIYDVATFFGIDISGMVQGYVEDAIEEAVTDEVPAAIEDALRDLELATDFELFGTSYHLEARPYATSVDDAGIVLALETFVRPTSVRPTEPGPGSLYAAYSAPVLGTTPGMFASLSSDFLNQALHTFWRGGLLTQTLGADDLGVDPAMLGLLLEELEDVQTISIDALLPPVVLPGSDEAMFEIQLGDLEVFMYGGGEEDSETMLLHFFVGLTADLNLTVTERSTLSASIENIETWIDVTEPVLPNHFEIETEALLLSLLPLIESQLTEALGEIPIPDFSGFTLSDITIETGGAENGYVTASGELVTM